MISTYNEWDPLKKVIVGIADFARIPSLDKSLRTVNYSHIKDDAEIPAGGLYPIDVIREANEDLDRLALELTNLGIEVVRPMNRPTDYYNFCPRDLASIIDTKQEGEFVLPLICYYFGREGKKYAMEVEEKRAAN